MGLFGKKKTTQTRVPTSFNEPPERIVRSIAYPYSANFKGTKRQKLSAYGSATAQAGINALKRPNPARKYDSTEPEYVFNFNGSTITVQEVEFGYPDEKGYRNKCLKIFVNQYHIGSIFDPYANDYAPFASALIWGRAELVHIKIEPEAIFEKGMLGSPKITERYSPYIFVKIKS